LVVAQVLAKNGQNIIAAAAAKVGNSNGANGRVVEEETREAPNAKKILGKNGGPVVIPAKKGEEAVAEGAKEVAEGAPAEEAPTEETTTGGRRRTRRRHAKKSKKSRKAKKSKKRKRRQ
jgi:hypothetical protein